MDYRTTPAEIIALMGDDIDFDIQPFIHTSHVMVEEIIGDDSVSESILTEIEKYLTAHLVSIREPLILEESIDDSEAKYMRKIQGGGLHATDYGQMAMQLDTSGKLSESMKPAAGIYIPDILTKDY